MTAISRDHQWVNSGIDFAAGGATGALSTVVIQKAAVLSAVGGLLIGATFMTVYGLSNHFLVEWCEMSALHTNFDSLAANIAIEVSRTALALLAALVASVVVASLAGYSLTALEIVAISAFSLVAKSLIIDPLNRGYNGYCRHALR